MRCWRSLRHARARIFGFFTGNEAPARVHSRVSVCRGCRRGGPPARRAQRACAPPRIRTAPYPRGALRGAGPRVRVRRALALAPYSRVRRAVCGLLRRWARTHLAQNKVGERPCKPPQGEAPRECGPPRACAQVEGGLGRDGAVDGVHAGLLAWYRSELSHSQRPKARIAQWLEPYLRRRVGDSELFTDFLKGAYRSKTGYESHRDSGERRISGGRFPHNTPIHCHKHLSVCLHSDYQPDSPAESAGEGDDVGGTRTRARGWGGECESVKM